MENMKETVGTKMKSRKSNIDYRSIAVQAGVVLAQGALWGLGSTLAGRLTAPKNTPKLDLLVGSRDELFPIKGSKTAIN